MRLKELELLDAVYRGDVDQVRKLLEDCVNPDALDEYKDETALISASKKGHVEIVKLLLAANATLDAVETDGYTALMFAGKRGHTETVKTLLDAGADMDTVRNRYNLTGRDYAQRIPDL